MNQKRFNTAITLYHLMLLLTVGIFAVVANDAISHQSRWALFVGLALLIGEYPFQKYIRTIEVSDLKKIIILPTWIYKLYRGIVGVYVLYILIIMDRLTVPALALWSIFVFYCGVHVFLYAKELRRIYQLNK